MRSAEGQGSMDWAGGGMDWAGGSMDWAGGGMRSMLHRTSKRVAARKSCEKRPCGVHLNSFDHKSLCTACQGGGGSAFRLCVVSRV
eukprot:XP_001702437.1 predicted protein [Chlamydomonas reinhardtii]